MEIRRFGGPGNPHNVGQHPETTRAEQSGPTEEARSSPELTGHVELLPDVPRGFHRITFETALEREILWRMAPAFDATHGFFDVVFDRAEDGDRRIALSLQLAGQTLTAALELPMCFQDPSRTSGLLSLALLTSLQEPQEVPAKGTARERANRHLANEAILSARCVSELILQRLTAQALSLLVSGDSAGPTLLRSLLPRYHDRRTGYGDSVAEFLGGDMGELFRPRNLRRVGTEGIHQVRSRAPTHGVDSTLSTPGEQSEQLTKGPVPTDSDSLARHPETGGISVESISLSVQGFHGLALETSSEREILRQMLAAYDESSGVFDAVFESTLEGYLLALSVQPLARTLAEALDQPMRFQSMEQATQLLNFALVTARQELKELPANGKDRTRAVLRSANEAILYARFLAELVLRRLSPQALTEMVSEQGNDAARLISLLPEYQENRQSYRESLRGALPGLELGLRAEVFRPF